MSITLSYLFRSVVLGAIVFLAYFVARFFVALRSNREQILDYRPIDDNTVEAAVKEYGRNTNLVVHLYGKLFYFVPELKLPLKNRPLVGYVPLVKQNVMITDPLCPKSLAKEVIEDFAAFTEKQDKDCLLFPVNQVTARQAAELGFGVLQVGKEPIFNLKEYDPNKHDSKILSSIRQTEKKGIVIESPSGAQMENSDTGAELKEIMDDWFLSRRSEKMQLISEVSPFKYSHEKKYFVARSTSRIEAFLSCSPVFERNGFFIHDLIRRSTAMNGISEALIVKALTTMKSEGYDFASLGIASLAGLDESGVNQNHPLINKVLVHVFKKHEAFMRFKSLYHFKKKFGPSSEEPAYLAFYPPKFKISYALAIGGMFSGRGLLGDILFKWKRWKEGSQLPQPLLNLLSPTVSTLPRSSPFTFSEFVSRLRFTFAIFGLNIYTYLNTSNWLGHVTPEVIQKYGFNFGDFMDHKWFILVTSNFIHFNYLHLASNMFLLFVFCGTLEFIGGSTLAALAFLLTLNSDVPMGILLPFLKLINFDLWQKTITYMDVGASLGIMGTLGALFQFLKFKRRLLAGACALTICLAVLEKHFFGIDHTFAILLGYWVGHLYLTRKYSKRAFQNLSVSFDSQHLHNSPIPFRSQNR